MARTTRWLALGGAAAAVAAAAAMSPSTALEMENAARGRTVRLAVGRGEVFSVTSRNSMYDQPVTEDFAVDADGRIALVAVSSPSAAVREYMGIAAAGERHQVERAMPEVVFRVATGTPQRLRLGGTDSSFLEFGDRGDRLVMRAVRRPAIGHALGARLAGTKP